VDKRRSQMTNYIFFLRVTPFLPNTFINVASPVVHVPYSSFAIGGVLGLLPNNVMAIKVGGGCVVGALVRSRTLS
jgi:uncharacterized membrane protein YdjX (TVP38/TMEM64 family)